MSETQFYARGPSGKFDVPIDESEINKQVRSIPVPPLPEEYNSPYLVPDASFQATGRAAIHAGACRPQLPPALKSDKEIFATGNKPPGTSESLL